MNYIIRNNNGDLIHAGDEEGRGLSHVLDEATTLRLGISEAPRLEFRHIQVE